MDDTKSPAAGLCYTWGSIRTTQATADLLRAKDREVATTGKTIELEFDFEKDGVLHSIHTTKYPLRDENGNITAVAGMWIDILPRTIAEKKAKQALAYRDRFLATLSHELRNPISAMNNAVQLIQRKLDDRDAVRRAVEIFSRQFVQVKRLLGDLLDLSRITRGEVELRKRVIDLREVASDSLLATRSVVQSHELNLESEITDQPLPVYGDPARLQQVIVNLLVNATKYTPKWWAKPITNCCRLEARFIFHSTKEFPQSTKAILC